MILNEVIPKSTRITADGGNLKLHAHVSLVLSVGLLASNFLTVPSACGQLAGHYIGGATGLEDGSAAPPGFFGTFFPVVERVNALKGPGGATIAKPDINLVANMAAYAVTTQKKVLGANYGLSVIFPVVNTRFTANLFNASAESAGLSDIYFAPIVLGWEKGNLNYTVNYGFYAPTGSFDPSSPLNPGLGYWEHQYRPVRRIRLASRNYGTRPSLQPGRSTIAGAAMLNPGPCSLVSTALAAVSTSTR
jgi:hypothetical protein